MFVKIFTLLNIRKWSNKLLVDQFYNYLRDRGIYSILLQFSHIN